LGVFPALGANRMTGREMAEALGTDARGTEILLDAISGLGLLEKRDGKYGALQEIRELLDSGGTEGGFSDGLRFWNACCSLTEVVRTGKPVDVPWTEESAEHFSRAMKQYAEGRAQELASAIDCRGAGTMLDLGGGAGCHSFALLKRYPLMKAVLFDRDEGALRIAARDCAGQKLEGRVALRKGDFLSDDFGTGFDLVLLSSIVCLFGKEEVLKILEKVRASLLDGGQVAILDMFVDEAGTHPVEAALFSVQMLLSTRNGRSHPVRDVKDWLKMAGFQDISWVPLDACAVVTGRK
jgi:predicted O-methyltransferase YrrM